MITIGSKNNIKISALEEVLADYELFKQFEILGLDVASEISEQPKSLDETITGAINRAKNAFQDNCRLSFGLEDGLMIVPNSKSNFMNVCACAIYDGNENHMGLSSAFEYPGQIIDLVLRDGLDISQAYRKAGLTTEKKLGASEGAIGLLTKGRLLRKEYTKQAIVNALIHLENSHLF